jgi:hypothetical protein
MKIPTSERNKAVTWQELFALATKYKHKSPRYYADLITKWRIERSKKHGK